MTYFGHTLSEMKGGRKHGPHQHAIGGAHEQVGGGEVAVYDAAVMQRRYCPPNSPQQLQLGCVTFFSLKTSTRAGALHQLRTACLQTLSSNI